MTFGTLITGVSRGIAIHFKLMYKNFWMLVVVMSTWETERVLAVVKALPVKQYVALVENKQNTSLKALWHVKSPYLN